MEEYARAFDLYEGNKGRGNTVVLMTDDGPSSDGSKLKKRRRARAVGDRGDSGRGGVLLKNLREYYQRCNDYRKRRSLGAQAFFYRRFSPCGSRPVRVFHSPPGDFPTPLLRCNSRVDRARDGIPDRLITKHGIYIYGTWHMTDVLLTTKGAIYGTIL